MSEGYNMIDIGINYITELDSPRNRYDIIYEFLIKKGYINTIKFPGKYCNYESLENAIQLCKDTNVKIDIHGFPSMIPSINSRNFLKNIEWKKLNPILLRIPDFKRISTHMGLENGDRLDRYNLEELEENWKDNIYNLNSKVQEVINDKLLIGVENLPGGFDFDIKTINTQYINDNWKMADFGVFDISHAKLSAAMLKIPYKEYLRNLGNKEKVKIIHISGNIDETNKYKNKPDKHVLINSKEIKDIIQVLNIFDNADLVVSEYGYNTKYSYFKELTIEAITISTIVRTMNFDISNNVLKYLEENLKDDTSNIVEVVNYIEKNIKL